MKYTAAVLGVLTAALLLASGMIASSNVEMRRLIEMSGKELTQLRAKNADQEEELQKIREQHKACAETLDQTGKERDALQKQLEEALAGAAQQTEENKRHVAELAVLTADYQELSKACIGLEEQLSVLTEKTVQAAAAYEQQMLSDAQRIAQLEQELAESVTPAETPFIPIRYRLPLN